MTKEELDAIKYAFSEALKPMNDNINARLDFLQDEINERFDEVNTRLDRLERSNRTIKSDIRKIKESLEETRTASNEAIKWLDTYHRKSDTPFPVDSENSVPSLNF